MSKEQSKRLKKEIIEYLTRCINTLERVEDKWGVEKLTRRIRQKSIGRLKLLKY